MEDDYAGMDAQNDSAGPSQAGDQPMDERDEKDEGTETALLPKSMFSGKVPEPGETVTLTIVHAYDDEIEVQMAEEPDKGSRPEMDRADEQLASMAH